MCQCCGGKVVPAASWGNIALGIDQLVYEWDVCLIESGY
jgi:hypothetical protein